LLYLTKLYGIWREYYAMSKEQESARPVTDHLPRCADNPETREHDSGIDPDGNPIDTDCPEESAHAARFLRAVKILATTPKSALGKPEKALTARTRRK
jgi:hypothetical protein